MWPRRCVSLALTASIVVFGGGTLRAQSRSDSHSAEEFAQSTVTLLKVMGALSRFLPKNGDAASFSTERLSDLNQARAEAERIMNDPTNAFLPLRGQVTDASQRPPCTSSRKICNPINARIDDVLSSPSRSFQNECTDTSGRGVIYELVECRTGWSSSPLMIKRIEDWDGRGGYVPTEIKQTQTKERIIYNGYPFADVCMPCRK